LVGTSLKALPEATGHPHQATILGPLATRLPAHLAGPQQVAFSKGEHSSGQLVMIHEDNASPQQWHLGLITNTCSGADRRVRVVDIKTAKGVIRRPIRKVEPLPISPVS